MRIRTSQLKAGDETVKGFIIESIAQVNSKMLKITYSKMIPNTDRNWEFAPVEGYSYIKEREEAR